MCGDTGYMGKSLHFSPQFSCEPKTAPKDRLTKTFLRVLKISLPSKPKEFIKYRLKIIVSSVTCNELF